MDGESLSLTHVTSVLRRALLALVVGDIGAIDLFTENVIGDGPSLCVRSRTELGYQLIDCAGALSNIEFDLDRVDTDASGAVVASWRVAGDHTGPVLFNEDFFFAASGRPIRVSATTHVQFERLRIAQFRTFYDDGDLFEQIRGQQSSADDG